jgi:hypothetical protein
MTLRMLTLSILFAAAALAVDKGGACYAGGSLPLPSSTEGQFVTSGVQEASFIYKGGAIGIPFRRITSIEYGQKAGRRIGAAIMISPVLLLSKKRKHYVTIAYRDSHGANQGVVLEIGKDTVRGTLTTLEARSGKKVEYESDDARRNAGN